MTRDSDYALYDYAMSTYDSEDAFDHEAGRGFTTITALPDRIVASTRRTPIYGCEGITADYG